MKPIDKVLLLEAVGKHIDVNSNKNILIIDDNKINRDLVRRYLSDGNINVFEAENGFIAIQLMESHKPDLIFLDLMMPVMDGFEFLDKIMDIEEYHDIPIIVITAKTLSSEESIFLNSRTSGVLQKGGLTKSDLKRQLSAILN
jgi:CheY-like chemotaxis protein